MGRRGHAGTGHAPAAADRLGRRRGPLGRWPESNKAWKHEDGVLVHPLGDELPHELVADPYNLQRKTVRGSLRFGNVAAAGESSRQGAVVERRLGQRRACLVRELHGDFAGLGKGQGHGLLPGIAGRRADPPAAKGNGMRRGWRWLGGGLRQFRRDRLADRLADPAQGCGRVGQKHDRQLLAGVEGHEAADARLSPRMPDLEVTIDRGQDPVGPDVPAGRPGRRRHRHGAGRSLHLQPRGGTEDRLLIGQGRAHVEGEKARQVVGACPDIARSRMIGHVEPHRLPVRIVPDRRLDARRQADSAVGHPERAENFASQVFSI